MSATHRVVCAESYTKAGVTTQTGSLNQPLKEVTTPGTAAIIERRYSLAAGETRLLWQYSDTPDFENLKITCNGFAWLAIKSDTPVSASNSAPSGTNKRWRCVGKSCVAPLYLDTDSARLNPTASDDVAEDAAGLPRVLTDTGAGTPAVDAKVYAIAAKNPGTSAIEIVLSLWN